MQVDFYHCAAAPPERVLARIARRVLDQGERLLVVMRDPAALERLDEALWRDPPDSFLPHGLSDAARATDQPVLLSPDPVPANGARHLALADGGWRDEALGFDRAYLLFDEAGIAAARDCWRALKGREGVEARYWKQDEAGRWAAAG